jgi:hypothetical protein
MLPLRPISLLFSYLRLGLRTGRTLLPRNIISLLLVLISVSKPLGLVRPEGLGKLKKLIPLIWSGPRDLPACSIVP